MHLILDHIHGQISGWYSRGISDSKLNGLPFVLKLSFMFYSKLQKALFGTIGRSFTKTMAMTIGEFGYEEIFNKTKSKALPLITWFLFALFLIVMTILLMNMLVSDKQNV